MPSCPDHGRPLERDPKGGQACPRCQGVLMDDEELDAWAPGARASLLGTGGGRARDCPICGREMTSFRLGALDSWLERCDDDGVWWLDRLDRAATKRLARDAVGREVLGALSDDERAAVARDVVGLAPRTEYKSPVHAALGAVGVPVVVGVPRVTTPWASLGLAVVEVAAVAWVDAECTGFLRALAAGLTVAGLGDAVEQSVPTPIYAVAASVLLVAGTAAEAVWPTSGAADVLAGALVGAVVVLSPSAKVAMGPIVVPVALFGVLWALTTLFPLCAGLGLPGGLLDVALGAFLAFLARSPRGARAKS